MDITENEEKEHENQQEFQKGESHQNQGEVAYAKNFKQNNDNNNADKEFQISTPLSQDSLMILYHKSENKSNLFLSPLKTSLRGIIKGRSEKSVPDYLYMRTKISRERQLYRLHLQACQQKYSFRQESRR